MIEIIFTYRPKSFKPISWVNQITRGKIKAPFDHAMALSKEKVYESVVKKGVHKMQFNEWIDGREGTYLFRYQLPANHVDFNVFDKLEGTGYDWKANIWFLLGLEENLKNNPNELIFCTELLALMLHLEDAHTYTPKKLEAYLRIRYTVKIDNL